MKVPIHVTYDSDEVALEEAVMEAVRHLTEAKFSAIANLIGPHGRWLAIGRAINRLVTWGKLEQFGNPNDLDNPVRYRIKK